MPEKIAIVGGGAAGFFAAIACAEANPANEVSIYERGPEFLTKVRISGGGRCNVTHACFDARAMSERYPRGERALIGFRLGEEAECYTYCWIVSLRFGTRNFVPSLTKTDT